MIIANPQLFHRERSCVETRHDGFLMVDLRAAARKKDLRVAATPSYYPSIIAFPPNHNPADEYPLGIPRQGILGVHAFNWNTLTLTGPGATNENSPTLWYWNNATFLPKEWLHSEQRILRLPFGIISPDIALAHHQANVLGNMLSHGGDHVVADPDIQGQQRIPYGKGNVPFYADHPADNRRGPRRWRQRPLRPPR